MSEYGVFNRLTSRLLAEGYTVEIHPEYVEVGRTCRDNNNPLLNFDGGFIYFRWYIWEKTFKTPCGLMVKGIHTFHGLSVNGIEFTYENDLALIHCPYHKKGCNLVHGLLPREGVTSDFCNVHMTDEEWIEEGSVEDILNIYEAEKKRKKESFILQKKGRVCERHMRFNMDTEEWEFNYNPTGCASLCYCGNSESGRYCPVLGRDKDKKRGNVYYDLKLTFRNREMDGTFFEGEMKTTIQKGIRFFDHPVSMDIARNTVKLCQDEIISRERNRHSTELFFAKYYDKHEFELEVINIRAEQKESRDLEQDLADLDAGIDIFYDSV